MNGSPKLRLAYLYPRLMNLYSDAGNILCLTKRCGWRGIELVVDEVDLKASPDFRNYDLVFLGGGEDRQQTIAANDLLETKGDSLLDALGNGLVCLAICGGYQLLAESYKPATGEQLPGLGHFKASTVHPGPGAPRCVGNVAARRDNSWLVGFENHGGRTTLTGSRPLASVAVGSGNNGKDGNEGAIENNAFGTYLHGSLLPKNPDFADELISLALLRRGIDIKLAPIDNTVEVRARNALLAKLGVAS
ncbi:MAG: putative cobyric acid synthase cobq [Chloroflexi bacterium]|nr:putative cobyric acid synthase cobq [Chloroflexota bacterium]